MVCSSPDLKSSCTSLKNYYNQSHTTGCHKGNSCKGITYRYHKYSGKCFPGYVHSCCAPKMPKHFAPTDFQCCTGNITDEKAKGVCNIDSCPYSGWCNGFMKSVCAIRGDLDSWTDKGQNCGTYIKNARNSTIPGARIAAESILSNTMKSQFPDKYKKEDLLDYGFQARLDLAKTYCPLFPGTCDKALDNYCKTATREDVTKSPDLLSLCGCYMQPKQYPYRGFVDTGCSMTCNSRGVIKPNLWQCKQTVCIIDNIDINMVNSEGNINLNQLCGSTGDSVCLLKDIDINAVNSKIGSGGVTINQQCTRCYKWTGDPTGLIPDDILMQHPGFETPEGYVPGPGWEATPCGVGGIENKERWILYGGIALFVIGIILLIILIAW